MPERYEQYWQPSRWKLAATVAMLLASAACRGCHTADPLLRLPGGSPFRIHKTVERKPTEPDAKRVELARAFRTTFPASVVVWDHYTGYVRQLSNFLAKPAQVGQQPEHAALAFVLARRDLFVPDIPSTELRVASVSEATGQQGKPTNRAVRLRQELDGIPVYEGELVVQLTPENSVMAIFNALKPITSLTPAKPVVTPARAVELAQQAVSRSQKRGAASPQRPTVVPLIHTLGNQGVRSWAVRISHWLVIVSAADGEILLFKDEARYADALVFDQNPVIDNNDPKLRALTNLGAATSLCGARFCVGNLSGETESSPTQEFHDPVADANFDDQMAYYHLELIATHFNGLDVAGPAAAVPVFSRDSSQSCNAYYAPDEFHLGVSASGCGGDCKPPAHYADIIYHEFTHRVLDTQVGLNYDETESGAIHEGTADFFSDSALGNPCLAEKFMSDQACLRDGSAPRFYPRDMDTEPHNGGEVWASALWTLRTKVGAAVAERILRQGMVGLPGNASFSDYAGNVVTQGVAYYSNLLNDDAWHNFFVLLVMGTAMEGSKQAFCEHGIAVPYGSYTDLAVRIPSKGKSQTWSIQVPAGYVVDTSRGCEGGYDTMAPGGWQDLKYFLDNKTKLSEYSVNVNDSTLTVTMKTPGGCADYNRIDLIYRLYYREAKG